LVYSYNRRGVAAEFRVLFEGYVGDRVASTVSFVRDGDVRVIIDPGMVPEPAAILGPLGKLVNSPDEITDVILPTITRITRSTRRSFREPGFTTSGRSIGATSGKSARRMGLRSARRFA